MVRPEKATPETNLEFLFPSGGGRFTRALERLRLVEATRLRMGRLAALMAALAWLPLALLAAAEGVALGDGVEVPLLRDLLPYGQFLVAVPALLLGDRVVGRRLGRAVAELRRSDILAPEDTPALDALLARAAAAWSGRGAHATIVLLTLAATFVSFWGAREWLSGSWQYVDGRLTMAGWWYLAISASILRFLTLRWVWRLLLWAWTLWRLARLRLQLRPAHPDRAGGLAFLGETQASFGVLALALSVQLSCLMADGVVHQGADLWAFRGHVTAFVLLVMILLVMPLLPFGPLLVRTRDEGLVSLSGHGYDGAVHLDQKLHASGAEVFSGAEISGLADFGALYENAQGMKPVPLDLRHVLVIAGAAMAPFLPLVFLVTPAQEVFDTVRKLVM